MRRLAALAVVLFVVATGCGRGYESENRAIVADLPMLEGIELIDEEHYGYCTSDSCPLGNDRSAALLRFTVDTEQWTQLELAQAFADGLDGWTATIDQICANADPSFCDDATIGTYTRDSAEIYLNPDNWGVGQFELAIDAQPVR